MPPVRFILLKIFIEIASSNINCITIILNHLFLNTFPIPMAERIEELVHGVVEEEFGRSCTKGFHWNWSTGNCEAEADGA